MNTKTMEGLVGARTNMELLNTPMRIFREAERKGDTETMKRAMGYANEISDRADQYKAEADEGLKEDAKEAREKAKLEREKAIEKRKAEREKLDERLDKGRGKDKGKDSVEVSEEGKVLLKESTNSNNNTDIDTIGTADIEPKTDTDSAKEPVIYTKTGEVSLPAQSTSISISV